MAQALLGYSAMSDRLCGKTELCYPAVGDYARWAGMGLAQAMGGGGSQPTRPSTRVLIRLVPLAVTLLGERCMVADGTSSVS
jgi:hypothetical protein